MSWLSHQPPKKGKGLFPSRATLPSISRAKGKASPSALSGIYNTYSHTHQKRSGQSSPTQCGATQTGSDKGYADCSVGPPGLAWFYSTEQRWGNLSEGRVTLWSGGCGCDRGRHGHGREVIKLVQPCCDVCDATAWQQGRRRGG